MKLSDFIQKHGLEMKLNRVERNPLSSLKQYKHYEATLFRMDKGRELKFTTYLSFPANKKSYPTLTEVLGLLAEDCEIVEETDVNNLVEDQSLEAFNVASDRANKLKDFLGPIRYYQLLDCED